MYFILIFEYIRVWSTRRRVKSHGAFVMYVKRSLMNVLNVASVIDYVSSDKET